MNIKVENKLVIQGSFLCNSSFLRELIKNKYLYLLVLPGVLYFFVFAYLPMIGIVIAFQEFNPIKGLFGSKFVGFSNFKFFLSSGDWKSIAFNTLFLNFLFISTGLLAQITLSIMLSEISGKAIKKIAQSIMLLPNFLSWTVISIFSIALFSTDEGFINHVLSLFGMESVNFYQNSDIWPFLLVCLRIWKGAGWGTIIYLATITNIERDMYESAKIDGASRLQSIVYITLPMIKTTTLILVLLAVGSIFYGDFGMIYALVGDNPMLRSTTDVIDTYVYRALRVNIDIGRSSAVGLFQSVLGFIMVISANTLVKKFEKESALF